VNPVEVAMEAPRGPIAGLEFTTRIGALSKQWSLSIGRFSGSAFAVKARGSATKAGALALVISSQ
jgi:hypothetical protein